MKHNLITILSLKYTENIHFKFNENAPKNYDNLQWMEGTKPSIEEFNRWIIEEDNKDMLALIRKTRNEKLEETDWRFRSDLSLNESWVNYCQQLRDLPGDESKYSLNGNGDVTVDWPEKPIQ